MKELIGDYESFIGEIDAGLKRWGIRRDEIAMMDHVCYRVETMDRYDEMKQLLGQRAFFLDESEVAGRLITTFEFDNPLIAHGWRVPYLELPQPKEGSPYAEGLEHAELVVVGSLERFQRNHLLPFDDKALEKLINPELGLKHEGVSVKFHAVQLGAVCAIEQRLAKENHSA
jgi:predicted metalloenzyme YecM